MLSSKANTGRGPVSEAEPNGTGLLRKAILHIDCNCFFVSCERLRNPELKNKPVIVGGGYNNMRRGVVSSASYDVRAYGVHAGMSLAKARKLCPQATILPCDAALYSDYSEKLIRILQQFSDKVEVASIDEAYVDLTGYEKIWGGTYLALLSEIQKAIDTILGISVSLGLADNKVTAKIAAGMKKPGITVIPSDETRDFLGNLCIDDFPGIGRAISKELHSIGIQKISDLQWWTYQEMKNYFGTYGDYLYLAVNGHDDRTVDGEISLPLSISKEHTFEYDQNDREQVFLKLRFLAAKVLWRLRKYGLYAREVRLKIRFADFSDFTKTHILPDFMSLDQDIMPVMRVLFEQAIKTNKKAVRLIGMGVSRLEKIESKTLFVSAKASPLQKAVDELNERYHELTILYGV